MTSPNTSSNFNDNNLNNQINKDSFAQSTSSYDQMQAIYLKNQNANYNTSLNNNNINNISKNELSPLKMSLNYDTFNNSNENYMNSMTNEYKHSNIGGWRQHQSYYQFQNDQHGSFHQPSSSYLID